MNTLHGECPLEKGEKWQVARFFHEKGQKQMCGLTGKHEANHRAMNFQLMANFLINS